MVNHVGQEPAKAVLKIDGFEISAWRGDDGLMRLEIVSLAGKETLAMLGHSWENGGGNAARVMFTDCEAAIRYIVGDDAEGDDDRSSPAELRRLGEDPVTRALIIDQLGKTPEEFAARIEQRRRDEGRDPETGAKEPRK